jgi:hypothetical protein
VIFKITGSVLVIIYQTTFKTYRYFIWSDSKVDKMITRTDPVIEVHPKS